MEQQLEVCPSCTLPIITDFYYCPHCGKQLKAKAVTVSVAKQIGVYLLSFFLPPFGLYPAIKYIKQSDPKTKLIGWIAVVLTIIGIIISIGIVSGFMSTYSQVLDQMSTGQVPGY